MVLLYGSHDSQPETLRKQKSRFPLHLLRYFTLCDSVKWLQSVILPGKTGAKYLTDPLVQAVAYDDLPKNNGKHFCISI